MTRSITRRIAAASATTLAIATSVLEDARGPWALSRMGEEGIATCRDGRVVRVNPLLARLCGLSRARMRGMELGALLTDVPSVGAPWEDADLLCADGGRVAVTVAFRDGGRVGEGHLVVRETRERDEVLLRNRHLATHDALTGLPNRTAFLDRMDLMLRKVRREECTLAVLALDLDRFKAVNDTLGHPVGDLLLKAVAGKLSAGLRETDLVARFGGDEFAIVLSGADSATAAQVIAQRLIASVSEPFVLDGHTVDIGVSIGISLSPDDGVDCDALMANADLALYRSKQEGRGRLMFFERDMNARMEARRSMEADLRHGLREGEFHLVYQPVVSTVTGRTNGFEAFLRWESARRGKVSPSEFLRLAEETGLMGEIGEFVLRRACSDAARWPGDVWVSVNLSASQFKARDLAGSVAAALAASGLEASRLEVEVTEDMLLAKVGNVLDTLRRIKALGVRVAVDDFGTGQSSLGYLRSIAFDAIKINPEFVDGGEGCQASLVRAVAALGRALGARTVAEGVEDAAQHEMMAREGCAEAQGYHLSRPIGSDAVLAHLRGAEAAGAAA